MAETKKQEKNEVIEVEATVLESKKQVLFEKFAKAKEVVKQKAPIIGIFIGGVVLGLLGGTVYSSSKHEMFEGDEDIQEEEE